MHKRRPSQSIDLNDILRSQQYTPDPHAIDPYQPSSSLQSRRSSGPTSSTNRFHRSSKQTGRIRASSSAVGIDFDLDTDDDDHNDRRFHDYKEEQVPQPIYPASASLDDHPNDRQVYPQLRNMMSSPSSSTSPHVLPSFSLSRPGRSRRSLTMLLLLAFLGIIFIFSLVPASRNRGKAAVDSIGGYAGQVWQDWKPSAIVGGGERNRIRQRPTLHADPSKTTRCLTSYDGVSNIVQYAVMIDAGSTGSRVHVYKFNYCNALPELEDEVFQMLRPGLSSFKGDPKAAADSLRPLLATSLAAIPQSLQSCTPIAVKATAGLRLLGTIDSKAILSAVRKMLKEEFPFQLADGSRRGVNDVTHGTDKDEGRAVEIMEGKDEGVFAWITVNYLLGLIGPPLPGDDATKTRQTAAVMDLGGASTQIVFEPSMQSGDQGMHPGEHVYELKDFGGRDYTLYQNSYLGYGLMQARKSINSLTAYAYSYSHPDVARTGQLSSSPNEMEVPSPCFALGTEKTTTIAKIGSMNEEVQVRFKGTTGGFKACKRLVEVMMDKDAACAQAPCSFAGVYQPSLMSTFRSGAPIVALSYFYDRLAPLGLASSSDFSSSTSPGFTIPQLAALAEDVCKPPSTWPSRFPVSSYPQALQELQDRPETCLDLTYLHSLLSLGYELEDSGDEQARPGDSSLRLRIEKKLAETELGWALGAAVGMVGEVERCRLSQM